MRNAKLVMRAAKCRGRKELLVIDGCTWVPAGGAGHAGATSRCLWLALHAVRCHTKLALEGRSKVAGMAIAARMSSLLHAKPLF